MIILVSFRTFRRHLFPKPVSCPGLFFATSYSKTALGPLPNFKTSIYQSQLVTRALCCTNALQKKILKWDKKKSISYYHFITLDITFVLSFFLIREKVDGKVTWFRAFFDNETKIKITSEI